MKVPATGRILQFKRAFVFVLIACLFMFAIFLKVSPTPHLSSSSDSPLVKIWVDPDQSSDTHTKIAPLPGIILAFIVCFALATALSPGFYISSSPLAFKTLFLSSRHWFRPPPAV